MIRHLMIAAIATALLPVSAEAAKMRYGGSRPSPAKPATAAAPAARPSVGVGVGAGIVVAPRVVRASRTNGQPGVDEPARVPFPPASAPAPALLRLTTAEAPKAWCAGETVIGGFCVVN
jgi:hypothetical protein